MKSDEAQRLKIGEALRAGSLFLSESSSTPELDSQLLLSLTTELSRLQLVVKTEQQLTQSQIEKYHYFLRRRLAGEPVAYITGVKEFWGLEFEVSPGVLIPRPETELIVENFLSLIADKPDPLLICDLGTGSGCIAVSIAFELRRRRRNFFILALDKSMEAIKIAKANARKHAVEDCIEFVCSFWATAISQSFDFILANPPYLMPGDAEIPEELNYEPQSALYAGVRGLDDYKYIFAGLPDLLESSGVFLGEFGYGQAVELERIVRESLPQASLDFHPDLRKIPRVIEVRI